MNLRQIWGMFKEIVMSGAKHTCKNSVINMHKKQTRRRREDMEKWVKIKKEQ